jgi:hypothetical protein
MQIHEVTLTTGKKVYGYISHIDYETEEFYLLDQKTPGMIGAKGDGLKYEFSQCQSVYPMTRDGQGTLNRQGDEQLTAWRRWARKNAPAV